MMKIIYSIIDKLLIIAAFIFMTVVLMFIVPIALLSVAWETGKEIKAGKKIKWWGMG